MSAREDGCVLVWLSREKERRERLPVVASVVSPGAQTHFQLDATGAMYRTQIVLSKAGVKSRTRGRMTWQTGDF